VGLAEEAEAGVLDEIALLVVDVGREHNGDLVVELGFLPGGKNIVLNPELGGPRRLGRV